MLDLWEAAERALRRAGVAVISRVDLCTRCNPELFFSHRRDGELRGAQGVIGAIAG
jgi:copper oxidase (laccase) domain-containing protein